MEIYTERFKRIKELVQKDIEFDNVKNDTEIFDFIEETVFNESEKEYISPNEKEILIENIYNSIRKLDIIQTLLDDDDITEIMVNGYKNIFIEKNGNIYKTNLSFENTEKLENIIQSIVSKVNRIVNESTPIVDARLENGSRVNVVLPPIALNGPILTIRKFSKDPFTLEKLIEFNTLSKEVGIIISSFVKARYNIFISGGTGSGKTTLLNVLSNFIPKDERIITIEDSAELKILSVENIVSLETRNTSYNKDANISVRDLIKTSLRMRPDRIIVGEVRGIEALDMLQAMNTGHDGSISTGHGNSSEDIIKRLETMVLTGISMPIEAIRMQIASAIDIVIHISRMRDKSRKVINISEVLDMENNKVKLNPIYVFIEEKNCTNTNVIGKLIRTKNEFVNKNKFHLSGIQIPKELL